MGKRVLAFRTAAIVFTAFAAGSAAAQSGANEALRGADEAQRAWIEGNAACVRGDFKLAARYFSEGIRLRPKDPVSYNNRAFAYLQQGDLKEAIADYNEALRLDPKYAMAAFFRGAAYEKQGDQDRAVADYAYAIRLDERYARAYCDAGLPLVQPAPASSNRGMPPAKSYFVATDGDDRNPGTIERPFATLYKAHEVVRPGDTVNLRAGVYQALISWAKSGTRAAPITVKAYRDEDVRLQSSEQYAWTRVKDPLLGDSWMTVIPNRPIRYPKVQHAVWQDAARAENEPNIGIWAIVKGGYLCAPMNAAGDFAHPADAKGLPLVDRGGRLLYDITWYDRGTKALWFKPGPSRVDDPGRQLYVTSSTSGQFSVAASYVRFEGLSFEYLFDFHQQDNPTGCEVVRCTIKHAAQGIVGGGTRGAYTSLFIDKIGDWLTWRNHEYERGYLSHCLYMNGTRCVVANCFLGRSNKGGPIHNYPDGFAENLFDGNVLYHCGGGSIFMGTGKNYITNNISLQKVYGFGPYISMQGFTFSNNYSEAANPFNFSYQEAKGQYSGTFERFAVASNVFNNQGGSIGLQGNIVDARQSRIDGNVYLGTPRWVVGLTQESPPRAVWRTYTDFRSFAAAVEALPHCAAWEKGSQARGEAPHFDFAAFDALLDGDPPLGVALAKARQYVAGVTAAFPAAGPRTEGSPARTAENTNSRGGPQGPIWTALVPPRGTNWEEKHE